MIKGAIYSNHFPLHFGSSALLLLYLLFYIIPPGLLPHAHHHTEEHLGPLESDPCHIAIFHPGEQGACQHKYHLTKATDECPLCHMVLSRQAMPDPVGLYDILFANTLVSVDLQEASPSILQVSIDNKGPPCHQA